VFVLIYKLIYAVGGPSRFQSLPIPCPIRLFWGSVYVVPRKYLAVITRGRFIRCKNVYSMAEIFFFSIIPQNKLKCEDGSFLGYSATQSH
jgi:hypothetical protein